MSFTGFSPIFLLLMLYSMFGAKRWARAIGVACFFQAASPVLLFAGGRVSGIAPAFLIMFIGLWYVYGHLHVRVRAEGNAIWNISSSTFALFVFVIIGIAGAILLPRFFLHDVYVLHGRLHGGLDGQFPIPLEPRGTNYIQAFYLVCILGLFSIPKFLISKQVIDKMDLIDGVIWGASLSMCLGFYQVAAYALNFPWPDNIINSNMGAKQWDGQVTGDLKRMSSTFSEPSFLAMHFLGVFALCGLGMRKIKLGIFLLLALILSTSSTAYFGLLGLLAVWCSFDIRRRFKKTLVLLFLITIVVAAFVLIDYKFNSGYLTETMVLTKLDGSNRSGNVRMYADSLGIDAFIATKGLGVGVGSMRCSSFLTTLLATVGFPGTLSFFVFIWLVICQLLQTKDNLDLAILFGLSGLFIGACISVPDINVPLFWLLAACSGKAAMDKRYSRGGFNLEAQHVDAE